VNGRRYAAGPGFCLLNAPGSLQKGYRPDFHELRYYWVLFDSSRAELAAGKAAHIQLPEYFKPDSFEWLAQMAYILAFIAREESRTASYLLSAILSHCANTVQSSSAGRQVSTIDMVNRWVNKKVRNREHIQRLSVAATARHFRMNVDYLSRLYRARTGITLQEKIIRTRIAYAKHLLTSGLSVKEVGQWLGFKDPKHFSGTFKSPIGMTPTQFRRSHQR